MSAFETCPLQYKLNYLDNIKRDERGIEAFMGSRFHEAMEKLYRDINFRIYALEELLDYYSKQWEKEYNDSVIVVNPERKPEDTYRRWQPPREVYR